MPKIRANGTVTPLPNEHRNQDTMTEVERELRYAKLRSADNPVIDEGTTQTRGESSGMVPISNKLNR